MHVRIKYLSIPLKLKIKPYKIWLIWAGGKKSTKHTSILHIHTWRILISHSTIIPKIPTASNYLLHFSLSVQNPSIQNTQKNPPKPKTHFFCFNGIKKPEPGWRILSGSNWNGSITWTLTFPYNNNAANNHNDVFFYIGGSE